MRFERVKFRPLSTTDRERMEAMRVEYGEPVVVTSAAIEKFVAAMEAIPRGAREAAAGLFALRLAFSRDRWYRRIRSVYWKRYVRRGRHVRHTRRAR